MKAVTKFLISLTLAGLCATSAMADVIVSNAAFSGSAFGQQSDAGSAPAYTQAFVTPTSKMLDKIVWWGAHGADSGGASFDDFVVQLDGVSMAGALTETLDDSGLFTQYTLDIEDILLTASTLSIINNSGDVAWFWQSAAAKGNPDLPSGSDVAFSLIGYGAVTSVPEPTTMALMAVALMALVFSCWNSSMGPNIALMFKMRNDLRRSL